MKACTVQPRARIRRHHSPLRSIASLIPQLLVAQAQSGQLLQHPRTLCSSPISGIAVALVCCSKSVWQVKGHTYCCCNPSSCEEPYCCCSSQPEFGPLGGLQDSPPAPHPRIHRAHRCCCYVCCAKSVWQAQGWACCCCHPSWCNVSASAAAPTTPHHWSQWCRLPSCQAPFTTGEE